MNHGEYRGKHVYGQEGFVVEKKPELCKNIYDVVDK
jgi:hypothetical protein